MPVILFLAKRGGAMGSYRLTWKQLGKGEIAIGHRPGKKLRKLLELEGCTHRLSLLSEKEMRKPSKTAGNRIHLPIESANPPGAARISEILACFELVKNLLKQEAKIYIHCSAGLHRTGMITHAFLRYLGFSRESALEFIHELRDITAREVGEWRLNWGNQFADYSCSKK